jgi:hypothetical protein
MKVLEEMINKMKAKIGSKYKLKIKNMVKKWEDKGPGDSGLKSKYKVV